DLCLRRAALYPAELRARYKDVISRSLQARQCGGGARRGRSPWSSGTASLPRPAACWRPRSRSSARRRKRARKPVPTKAIPSAPCASFVPTAAGGSIDTTARVVAAALAERWGKPVVIENRPGAGMIIGAEAAAKSPPDGYTLLVAHDGTIAMNPVVYPNLAYHSQRDFEPLALLTSIAEVVLVNEAVPVKSIRELIAFAKANPGKLNHASGGTATLLALELFKAVAQVDITNIPFRGGAPAVTGVMSGETQVIFADLATAHAGMRSGKLPPLPCPPLNAV